MSLKSCMLGLHVGDSLGASLEFLPPAPTSNFHTEIIGGGKHNWPVGSPTDDTELAIVILESLIENQQFDIYDISGRFMEWVAMGPADIGRTTFLAINNLMSGISPFKSGLSGKNDQGNGSLMRSAPLAYFRLNNNDLKKQTAITHNHPICISADHILVQAIKDAERGVDKETIFKNALKNSDKNKILQIYLENIPTLSWENLPSSGYVVHTLGAAFWGLLHTNSFEEAVIQTVNRGDDADSVGAVCGALCGAYYGEKAIPKRWLDKIQLKEKIENLLQRKGVSHL